MCMLHIASIASNAGPHTLRTLSLDSHMARTASKPPFEIKIPHYRAAECFSFGRRLGYGGSIAP